MFKFWLILKVSHCSHSYSRHFLGTMISSSPVSNMCLIFFLLLLSALRSLFPLNMSLIDDVNSFHVSDSLNCPRFWFIWLNVIRLCPLWVVMFLLEVGSAACTTTTYVTKNLNILRFTLKLTFGQRSWFVLWLLDMFRSDHFRCIKHRSSLQNHTPYFLFVVFTECSSLLL